MWFLLEEINIQNNLFPLREHVFFKTPFLDRTCGWVGSWNIHSIPSVWRIKQTDTDPTRSSEEKTAEEQRERHKQARIRKGIREARLVHWMEWTCRLLTFVSPPCLLLWKTCRTPPRPLNRSASLHRDTPQVSTQQPGTFNTKPCELTGCTSRQMIFK